MRMSKVFEPILFDTASNVSTLEFKFLPNFDLFFFSQGKGSMAVSNSIGSNTFNILTCLGLPWMIEAIQTRVEEDKWIVKVQSDALTYTVVSLLISLIILYSILLASRFLLSKTLGFVTLIIYAVFLTISLLFELNVFYDVNLPTCPSKFSWKKQTNSRNLKSQKYKQPEIEKKKSVKSSKKLALTNSDCQYNK